MNYRKDIQILRGVSVLLVVLFHLEIGFVKSGFLGVDVFFVISGFLMAILYDSNKKFDFFLRRANRLLPAYYVVILFVLIASIFINNAK
jgi:peptidoglycan/LPS O-acetylase OafA/YrhL